MKFSPELLALVAMAGSAAADNFPVMTPPPYDTTSVHDDKPTHTYDSEPTMPTYPPTCHDGKPDCSAVIEKNIPWCAAGCFEYAAPEVHCDAHDYACLCDKREKLTEASLSCLKSYCGEATLPQIAAGVDEVCKCAKGSCGGGDDHPDQPVTYPPYPTSTKKDDDVYPTTSCTTDDKDAHDVYPTGYPHKDDDDKDKYPHDDKDKYPHDDKDKYPHDDKDKYPVDKYPTGGYLDLPKVTTCHEVTMTYYPTGYPTATAAPVNPCKEYADKIEACAKPCFEEAIPKIPCALDDYACQCKPEAQKAFEDKLLPCLAKKCDSKVLPALLEQAAAVCECAAKYPHVDYPHDDYPAGGYPHDDGKKDDDEHKNPGDHKEYDDEHKNPGDHKEYDDEEDKDVYSRRGMSPDDHKEYDGHKDDGHKDDDKDKYPHDDKDKDGKDKYPHGDKDKYPVDDKKPHDVAPICTTTTTCYEVEPTFYTHKPVDKPTATVYPVDKPTATAYPVDKPTDKVVHKPTETKDYKPVVTAGASRLAVGGLLGAVLAVAAAL